MQPRLKGIVEHDNVRRLCEGEDAPLGEHMAGHIFPDQIALLERLDGIEIVCGAFQGEVDVPVVATVRKGGTDRTYP